MIMVNDITEILKKLNIKDTGTYHNHFYIIDLEDSDAYARMYTNLEKNAINTEYPTFGKNTADTTVKITNYFEISEKNVDYLIFLQADFDNDKYTLKISEETNREKEGV